MYLPIVSPTIPYTDSEIGTGGTGPHNVHRGGLAPHKPYRGL